MTDLARLRELMAKADGARLTVSARGPDEAALLAFLMAIHQAAPGLFARIESLDAENGRLRTALREARCNHDTTCPVYAPWNGHKQCECGAEDQHDRIEAALAPEPP